MLVRYEERKARGLCQLDDLRAFRVYEAVVGLGGARNVSPGSVFPSLQDIAYTPADELDMSDAEERAATTQIKAVLQMASVRAPSTARPTAGADSLRTNGR